MLFMQANIEQIPDVSYINTNNVDGLIAISEGINKKIENIEKISILEHIRALNLIHILIKTCLTCLV